MLDTMNNFIPKGERLYLLETHLCLQRISEFVRKTQQTLQKIKSNGFKDEDKISADTSRSEINIIQARSSSYISLYIMTVVLFEIQPVYTAIRQHKITILLQWEIIVLIVALVV